MSKQGLSTYELKSLNVALIRTYHAIREGKLHWQHAGLCHEIRYQVKQIMGDMPSRIHDHLEDDMAGWPDGTGCVAYPIPSSYTRMTSHEQYDSRHNKWGGKQLKYRLALLQYLIAEHKG